MPRVAKPKLGDWIGLAMHRQVPGVTRDTLREEAIERLIEWNALQSLRKYELAPGWTVADVLNDLAPQYYRDVAAELAARPPGTRLKPMELKTKVQPKGRLNAAPPTRHCGPLYLYWNGLPYRGRGTYTVRIHSKRY